VTIAAMALRDALGEVARAAGAATMAVRRRGFGVIAKGDGTPVTEADERSQAILIEGLTALTPGVAWVSEEHVAAGYEERAGWEVSWSIDPLDGTRNFIEGSDGFSVNLGLIVAGRPAFGLIHAPAQGVTYVGAPGEGAFRQAAAGRAWEPIAVRAAEPERVRVVLSRHPASGRVADFLAALAGTGVEVTVQELGGALKMCRIAEGGADLYPRYGATYEWDTAAGEAILRAAGGIVAAIDGGGALRYNKPDLRNPAFYAAAGVEVPHPNG
jgi:3'(2'), 5'-bisphosphate nucleotidase